jgi:hypothetical protein
MAIQVNINQAKDLIIEAMRHKLVPMVHGSPAVGKSSVVQQIAQAFGLYLIDLRLSQCDPTDLLGFPTMVPLLDSQGQDTGKKKATYAPMTTFPLDGEAIPKGYNGWLLFLDELPLADRGVQKAAYRLILDREVGDFKLHDKVAICAAGNLETDNAMVEEMSTALQSRLVHLEVKVDREIWLEWAGANGIDHRITSFVNWKPELLYNFKPDSEDRTYASPRTWEFSNRLLQTIDLESHAGLALLAGTVGEGVAREFISFSRIHNDLPTIDQIIRNGDTLAVPSDPGTLFALSGAIGAHATEENVTALMKFVNRMSVDFQVVTLREMIRRNKKLLQNAEVGLWAARNADELF